MRAEAAVAPGMGERWEVQGVPALGANQVLDRCRGERPLLHGLIHRRGMMLTEFPRTLGYEPVGEVRTGVNSRREGEGTVLVRPTRVVLEVLCTG